MLISDRFWRRRFPADPRVLEKRLRFGQGSFEMIGVMPASFRFPDRDVDIWLPSPIDGPFGQRRELTWFNVIGQVKPGVAPVPRSGRIRFALSKSSLGLTG